MSDINFKISAVDTLMFRDGRPFNQGDAGASVASSVFPPYPPTLVGALRATFWSSMKSWDAGKLGTGTNWQVHDKYNTLTPLRFGPPILMKNGMPVFPVPLHVVEGKTVLGNSLEETVITFLHPDGAYTSDLGIDVLLPTPVNTNLVGVKTISDRWVTMEGMTQILSGKPPAKKHFVELSDLWEIEPRVGIGIKGESRATSDGRLYMASHIRMVDDVSLNVGVTGLSDEIVLPKNGSLRPVAGEHRMAGITKTDAIKFPSRETAPKAGQVCIIAISPVVPNAGENKAGYEIAGINTDDLVSACLGKPIAIGGWNSQRNQSIPLKNCCPAGSVWFLKEGASIPETIGQSTNWGFGQILIGTW